VDAEHDLIGERASKGHLCVQSANVRKTAIGLSGHGFPETENEITETTEETDPLRNIHHMIFFAFLSWRCMLGLRGEGAGSCFAFHTHFHYG